MKDPLFCTICTRKRLFRGWFYVFLCSSHTLRCRFELEETNEFITYYTKPPAEGGKLVASINLENAKIDGDDDGVLYRCVRWLACARLVLHVHHSAFISFSLFFPSFLSPFYLSSFADLCLTCFFLPQCYSSHAQRQETHAHCSQQARARRLEGCHGEGKRLRGKFRLPLPRV